MLKPKLHHNAQWDRMLSKFALHCNFILMHVRSVSFDEYLRGENLHEIIEMLPQERVEPNDGIVHSRKVYLNKSTYTKDDDPAMSSTRVHARSLAKQKKDLEFGSFVTAILLDFHLQ